MSPLGFLGAGNMAEAIVRAVLARGVVPAAQCFASDPSEGRRALFASLGVTVSAHNRDTAGRVRTLILSCKPQQMKDVLGEISPVISSETLLVSIAAGVSTEVIARHLGKPVRVVRVMPNTPLMMGEGMAAIAAGEGATVEDVQTVLRIFEVAGRVVEVREALMDAVTAVSGSGPAYFFLLTEQLARAAVELGLDAETADVLARQTALGSAVMLAKSLDSPEELRRKVTSPGGTTQAAVEHLTEQRWQETFRHAVAAAERRGRELRGG
jgi:pyrroline-5-carboxylate reductase